MPTYFQRPENALKRANELLLVGKKQRALDALYDVIKSKKHKTWQKIHEPIMNQYLVLCVDLKKSHIAKEGLFQYRNICQQMNIKSLEDVVRGYLKLAEDKTDEARQQSQQAVVDIDDLDQITTPENMLLSAVSGEDSQDRTDRVVLIPWVKFLWESYRQCLELLRNNSRVERLYHDIAQQAFKFCLNYTRKTEFRKLCDNLRAHLGQIQKHQHQQTAINLNNPESQAMHLETRLVQLDSSITMELWQEAYKAIEDIHGLMALSKKSPKPQLMANYYQKLALVFWKAGNHLFHAAALFRLFSLSREMKKNLTPDDLQKMATRVTMATLAVPLPPARSEVDRFLETDESVVEKNRKLAALLGLTNPPTRMSLVKDLIRQNVLPYAMTQIQELHKWLEIEFHPLDLCDRIDVCLKELEKNEELVELQHYIPAVQKISVMRLLFQVSQVYQSIEFNRLLKLAPFISQFQLESLIVDAVRRNDLQVIIDHKNESLHFGHNLQMTEQSVQGGCNIQSMPGEAIRNQLVQMCDVLTNVVFTIQPGQKQQKNEEIRQRVVTAYKNTADKEHKNILQRRLIIEKRKEYLENQNIQREEEERHQQEITRRNQQMAETERLKREAEERDRQRRLLEIKEVQKKQVKDRIEQLKKSDLGARIFQDIDEEELENLDADTIMAKQVEQLDKERKELQTRLKSQEKKIDYMERAKRLAEIPFIQNAYKEFLIKDQESWEQQESERVSEAIRDRQVALQTSERLMLLRDDKEKFLNKLKSDRGVFYNTKLSQFEETLETKREIRLQERKEKRKTDRRQKMVNEREEEKLRQRDEQLKREREQEESEAVARKARMDEEYKQRMEKLNEIEAKKQEREKEIEDKRRREAEEREKEREVAERKDNRGPRPIPNATVRDIKVNQRDEGFTSWRGGSAAEEKNDEVWRKPNRPEDTPSKDDNPWRRGKDDGGGREDQRFRSADDRMPPRENRATWRRDGDRDNSDIGRGNRDDRPFSRDNPWGRRGPERDDRPPQREENAWRRNDREDKPPVTDVSWRQGERDERQASRDDGPWRRDKPPVRDENPWRHADREPDNRPRDDGPWRRGSDRPPQREKQPWRRGDRDQDNNQWRNSRNNDDRGPGDDRWRKSDDGSTGIRRVPADKDGFPADRMAISGRRAPPPRDKNDDRRDDDEDDGWRSVRR